MPDLFGSLRGGLKDHQFVRDFIVLPSKDNVMGFVSHKYFRLNADEIPDLIGKVHILEGNGFIRETATASLYRMSEQFATYLTIAAIPTVNKVLPKEETELTRLAKSILEQEKKQ